MRTVLNICREVMRLVPLLFLPACQGPEQYVVFAQEALSDVVIAQGIDLDGDGQISYREAGEARALIIPPSGISDPAGLEAFIHLDSLSITLNPLSYLELGSMEGLRYLSVTSCGLEVLDLSGNLMLEALHCGRNQLQELDVLHLAGLQDLSCNNNLLTVFDPGPNTGLVKLITCGNQLTLLDVTGLTKLSVLGIDNMPMLEEVCVWSLPFPPEGIRVLMDYSPNVSFRLCASEEGG